MIVTFCVGPVRPASVDESYRRRRKMQRGPGLRIVEIDKKVQSLLLLFLIYEVIQRSSRRI